MIYRDERVAYFSVNLYPDGFCIVMPHASNGDALSRVGLLRAREKALIAAVSLLPATAVFHDGRRRWHLTPEEFEAVTSCDTGGMR